MAPPVTPEAGDEDRSFDQQHGAEGAPHGRPRERGSQADGSGADAVNPGREFGAGGQKDDGPDVGTGAGAGTGGG